MQRIKGSIQVFAAVAIGRTTTCGYSTKMTDTSRREGQANGSGNEISVHVLVGKRTRERKKTNKGATVNIHG